MADFNAKINLDADNSKALRKIEQVEKAVNRIDAAVNKVGVKVEGTKQAEQEVSKLYKALERLENAALSKLPRSVQMVIAYLKAATQVAQEFGGRLAFAGAKLDGLQKAKFIPAGLLAASKEVKTLNKQLLITFEQFKRINQQFAALRQKALPPAGYSQGFTGFNNRGGGYRGGGTGAQEFPFPLRGGALARIEDTQLPKKTLDNLEAFRSQLIRTFRQTEIGTAQFRKLENAIAEVTNEINDAQLKGQRGGSGVGGFGKGRQVNRLGQAGSIADLERQAEALEEIVRNSKVGSREFKEYSRQLQRTNRQLNEATNKTKNFFERLQNPQSRLGSAVIGGGFPLITGGGLGSVLGGVAGGAVGGFAGSIAGSATGQVLDDFILRQQELARSLQTSTDVLGALEAANVRVSSGIKVLVSELEKAGESAAAFRIQQRELQKAYGSNAQNDLRNYDNAQQRLADVFNRLGSAVMPILLRGATLVTEALADVGNELIKTLGPLFDFLDGIAAIGAQATRRPGQFVQATQAERDLVTGAGGRTVGQRRVDQQADRFSQSAFGQQLQIQRQEEQRVRAFNNELKALYDSRVRKAKELRDYESQIRQLAVDSINIQTRALANRLRLAREERAQRLAFQQAGVIAADRDLQNDIETTEALVRLIEGGSVTNVPLANVFEELQQYDLKRIQSEASDLGETLIKGGYSAEDAAEAMGDYINMFSALAIQEREYQERTTRSLEDNFQLRMRDLELETKIIKATTDGERYKLGILQEQNRAREEASRLGLNLNQTTQFVNASVAKFAAANQPISELSRYITDTEAALNNLDSQLVNTVQIIEGQLASGIANMFIALVDGSKSAEEAFADMLKGMGAALIQQGAIMIAQYIAIGIARAFAGMSPAATGDDAVNKLSGQMAVANTANFFRASGGPVMANRPYVVGERGPELFLPHQSGYIQSNTATRASLPQNTQPRTIRFETTMINNVEYVTKEEAIAIGRQAADDGARRGAKMGVSQTMSGLQNSRSQRAKLGMR